MEQRIFENASKWYDKAPAIAYERIYPMYLMKAAYLMKTK